MRTAGFAVAVTFVHLTEQGGLRGVIFLEQGFVYHLEFSFVAYIHSISSMLIFVNPQKLKGGTWMTDVSAITTRLIAMCESITGITSADDVLPDCLDAADLPFMFISEGAATHSANNDGTVETAREWLLVLYVKAFSETDRPGEKTARDACRPFLASVVKFFWERRGLQLSTGKSPLGFMTDARLARDEGIQTLAYCNKLYAGVPFRLTVSYTDDLTLF